jgi:Protein of unknown function (DUF3307)
MTLPELILAGWMAHFVADWIFQNEWIALNKPDLTHRASWIHGAIHLFFTAFFFPLPAAICIAAVHMLIDTRYPINWWMRVYKQTSDGEMGNHVRIWEDQGFHLFVIYVVAHLVFI